MAKAHFEFLFYLQLIQRLKYLVVFLHNWYSHFGVVTSASNISLFSSTIGTLTLVSSLNVLS